MNSEIILNSQDIRNVLAQTDPFLFVEEANISKKFASSTYAISGKEFFLEGHFKDFPIFPASILMEAAGQLASLHMLFIMDYDLLNPEKLPIPVFSSTGRTSCHGICKPKDVLTIESYFKILRPPMASFNIKILNEKQEKLAYVENLFLTAVSPAELKSY